MTLVALVVAGALLGPSNASTPPRPYTDAVLSIQQPAGEGLALHSCTAILIEPDKALTAAHCVTPTPRKYKEKVAAHDKDVCGSVDLSDRPSDPQPFGWMPTVVRGGTTDYRRGGETSTVTAVHPMPGWDWGEGDDPLQDLAVVELDPPMTIPPAKIEGRVPEVGSRLRTAGWTTRPDRCGGIEPAMRQWNVTAVPCHSHAEIVCASTGGTPGPCEGVSGAPMWATAEDGATVLVGVYSGSPQEAYCGETMSLYTLISAHQRWITDTVGPRHRCVPRNAANPVHQQSKNRQTMSTIDSGLITPLPGRAGDHELPVGVATDRGPRRPLNADSFAAHRCGDTQAVVVFDGTGSTPEVVEFADHAAWSAARVAARKGPSYAILHAADLNANPDNGPGTDSGAGLPEPDGAIVVATVHPTAGWSIAYAGDCTAFSVHDGHAQRVTRAHTVGQVLRDLGQPDDVAAGHDHQLIHSLGRARPGTVPLRRFQAPIVVLGSDGLKLTEAQVAEVINDHHADPAAADAIAGDLVAAARPRGSDDITALVAFAPTV